MLAGELAAYLSQIDEVQNDAERLLAGLTDRQFNWRPALGKWSIAECLSHLEVVGRKHLPRIDEAIGHAHAARWHSDGPFKYGFVEKWFVHANEPPPRIRMKAPRAAAPLAFQPRRELWAEFVALQEELRERIRQAQGLDLARAKVNSPFMRPFRLGLGTCLAFLAAHQRRHLWQARQVRSHADFPA
jgi:DinB superfamily